MARILHLLLLFFLLAQSEVKGQMKPSGLEFDLSNPGCFGGTDFGSFFQRLYFNQDYARMLIFTSMESRKKYGDERLLNFYREMDFAYPLRLKSKSVQGDTIWLNYQTIILATSTIVRMPVVVERDTVRMIILSIKKSHLLPD